MLKYTLNQKHYFKNFLFFWIYFFIIIFVVGLNSNNIVIRKKKCNLPILRGTVFRNF